MASYFTHYEIFSKEMKFDKCSQILVFFLMLISIRKLYIEPNNSNFYGISTFFLLFTAEIIVNSSVYTISLTQVVILLIVEDL